MYTLQPIQNILLDSCGTNSLLIAAESMDTIGFLVSTPYQRSLFGCHNFLEGFFATKTDTCRDCQRLACIMILANDEGNPINETGGNFSNVSIQAGGCYVHFCHYHHCWCSKIPALPLSLVLFLDSIILRTPCDSEV